ncbi:MAG TPA: L-rhamnose/proton symporter RhaT [Sedimentisphaerales bacterium]|nr:L-rhamnose/proton symporter RhaT [Sedimentisphaerales bacterium]
MEDPNAALGIALGITAGAFLGSFALPMKKTSRWQWENTWIMYSFWALIVLPVVLAFLTIPGFPGIYGSVSAGTILAVFLFGAGWGVANVGFGTGLKLLGLALGTAIVLGLNNAIGAIVPLIRDHPEDFFKPVGLAITTGVAVMLVGIAVCSVAGAKKGKALRSSETESARREGGVFVKGLIVCLVAGVFGAMFNFALIAGKPIEEQAVAAGATPLNAANATWCLSLLGGFVVTLLYCLYLYKKNNSFRLFTHKESKMNWLHTFLMGIMWFAGVAIYGMAVSKLGRLGPSIGWPVIQSMAVASGNVWGIVTGEWKGTGKAPLRTMIAGLLLLFAGIVVIGWSSTLQDV